MKGMNTTLALNESDNEKPDTLESIFNYSCVKNGVSESQRDTLIKNGMPFFEFSSNGDVFPLGSYQSIGEYVLKHRGDVEQAEDSSDLTTEQLYNQLAKAASSGNMKEYRRLRTQYSAAV